MTWLLAMLALSGSLHAAAPEASTRVDSDWILDRLARPAPMRTAFVELRESRLLKAPLRLVGEYRRPQDEVLVREVRSPYRETTTIEAGQATIQRAGKSPRSFALDRAPELAGMQASFGALLSGDRETLLRYYEVSSNGTRQDWELTLVPKQALAGKVERIDLHGRGAELRCMETLAAGETEPQRTLLAGAASDAAELEDPADLQALCRGDDNP
ncbi:MAG: LolA-related protein [Lysobacter spongiicola]|nr:LolA-related protein [Lysobacter spongiicola]